MYSLEGNTFYIVGSCEAIHCSVHCTSLLKGEWEDTWTFHCNNEKYNIQYKIY